MNDTPAASMEMISELDASFDVKKNHGNEHEQRTEQVGEVGHEVGVIVEYDGLERCMVLRKLREVLVDIEYDTD